MGVSDGGETATAGCVSASCGGGARVRTDGEREGRGRAAERSAMPGPRPWCAGGGIAGPTAVVAGRPVAEAMAKGV